jgi:PAS domain S-box-containing protein
MPAPTLERFTECVVPEDRTRVMAAVSRTLSSRRAGHTVYFRIRRPDGAERHLMSRARLSLGTDGRPQMLAGIDVDLSSEAFEVDTLARRDKGEEARAQPLIDTAPKEADPFAIAMQERDDLLRIIDAMPIMVTVYDPSVQMVLVNRAFEEITGWSREETAAGRVMETVYPDPGYRAEIAGFMERCAGWKEITMRARDGRDVATCWTNIRLSDQRRLGIGLDLSFERDLERTLSSVEATLRLAQQTARLGTFEWNIQTGRNRWSPELERLYGLPEGTFGGSYEDWVALVFPEDLAAAESAIAEAHETGSFVTEWRTLRPDGTLLWIEARALVEKAADGTPLRMVGVNLDITERKQAEEGRELALREMAHRVQNLFAVVRAIAGRTFARDDPDAQTFQGRLSALSAAHEVLLAGETEGGNLGYLIRRTIAAFGEDERFVLEGPELQVGGKAARMLALAVHELATNALKHGALSNPEGHVEIAWGTENASHETFRLIWRERGGPDVSPPGAVGFGTVLLERLVPRDLGGSVDLTYAAAGVECTIRWPTQ